MVGASFNWNNQTMAPKKAPLEEQPMALGDAELDQAIDDLRGVLKSDATGTLPDTDFGMDFGAETATTDFGSEFDAAPEGGEPFGSTDFASTDFGTTDFGSTDFASSDFGSKSSAAAGLDADTFGASAFGAQTSSAPGSGMHSNLDLIMDIPIDVQVVLGSSRMQVSGLMSLSEGATIALDRKIGDAVDIVVNGRVIGRGEITVLEDDDTRFGVKLIEIKGGGKTA